MKVALPEQRIAFVLEKDRLPLRDVQRVSARLANTRLFLLVQADLFLTFLASGQVGELQLREVYLYDTALLKQTLMEMHFTLCQSMLARGTTAIVSQQVGCSCFEGRTLIPTGKATSGHTSTP